MRKKEIIKSVAQKTGMKISDVSRAVEGLLQTISEKVSEGETIYFRGFGRFYPANIKLKGYNFSTKQRVHSDDVIVVPKFKAYDNFTSLLEKGRVMKSRANYDKAYRIAMRIKRDKVIKQRLMEKPVLSKEQVSQCFDGTKI